MFGFRPGSTSSHYFFELMPSWLPKGTRERKNKNKKATPIETFLEVQDVWEVEVQVPEVQEVSGANSQEVEAGAPHNASTS